MAHGLKPASPAADGGAAAMAAGFGRGGAAAMAAWFGRGGAVAAAAAVGRGGAAAVSVGAVEAAVVVGAVGAAVAAGAAGAAVVPVGAAMMEVLDFFDAGGESSMSVGTCFDGMNDRGVGAVEGRP